MRTAISSTMLKLSFSIDVLLRQICSSCCAICPSFVGSIAPAQRGGQTRQQDGHTFCNLHTVYLGMFFRKAHYKTSVRHQRLLTNNKLCQHKSPSQNAVQKRSNATTLCHGGIHSDRHARTAYCLHVAFIFSTARTGSIKQQAVSNFRRNLRYCLPTSQRTADPKLRRLNLRPF